MQDRIQAVSKQMLQLRAKPLKVRKADALYEVPPIQMLIEGFVPRGMIVGLTSYPGTGKTWVAFEAARAVATGTPFLGKYRVNHGRGRVLLVLADASEADYGRQWRRLTEADYLKRAAETTPDPEIVGEREEENEEGGYSIAPIYADEPVAPETIINPYDGIDYLAHSDFLFESPDAVRALIERNRLASIEREGEHLAEGGALEQFDPTVSGYDLIVFDTLSALTRMNQNDNSEMEVVFRNIRLIGEQTKAAILLLHHNSKPSDHNEGSDWRGAMSQIGALDCWFQLGGPKKSQERVLTARKFRGITPAPIRFRLDVNSPERAELHAETDEEAKVRQSADVVTEQAKADKVREAVEALRALGEFKRSQADAVLQRILPGWLSKKAGALEEATPKWLLAHGFRKDGKGASTTYSYDSLG